MRIGIVSDLHGHVPAALHDELHWVDRILCAGDVQREEVLWELETIAPVICVRGNNDWSLGKLPASSTFTLGGVKFFMAHFPSDMGKRPAGTQVCVHGHTHVPRDETRGGVRFLNPGSTTFPRGGSEPSCMRAVVEGGKISNVQLIALLY